MISAKLPVIKVHTPETPPATTSPVEQVLKHAPITPGPSDVYVWPDDEWCFRDEIHDLDHRSDDHQILYHGTPEYIEFMKRVQADGY